jgi:transposase
LYDFAAASNKLGMRPYSEDLRKRIIEAKRAGKSSAEVAERFAVCARTVERYWRRYEQKGHCRVEQIGGYRRSRLAGHEKVVAAWIQAQPDLTLEELCARCQKKLRVTLSVSALWHRLQAMGLSYKKKDARRRTGSP